MKFRLMLVAVLLALVSGPSIQKVQADACDVLQLGVVGTETITVSNSAIGFTAAKLNPTGKPAAKYAVVTTETDQIRWWDDGTVPTSASGHLVSAGTTFTVCQGAVLRDFLMIRVTNDVKATVSYYGIIQ